MLIITNGQSAERALTVAGIRADILSWDDTLHDGPVPSGLDLSGLSVERAAFLASCGWGSLKTIANAFARRNRVLARCRQSSEVLLWFEHDLYDQLQLLQVLDWLSSARETPALITLICTAEYISESSSERLRELFLSRSPVLHEQYCTAQTAWAAFRSPDPEPLTSLIELDLCDLPFLRPAILRLLQEYPDHKTGLARSQRQVLESVQREPKSFSEIFRCFQARENPRYLGDFSLWNYTRTLATCPVPLLATPEQSLPEALPLTPDPGQLFCLTRNGMAVLKGRADHISLNGISRWLGGVHLLPNNLWRWNPRQMRLVRSPVA